MEAKFEGDWSQITDFYWEFRSYIEQVCPLLFTLSSL